MSDADGLTLEIFHSISRLRNPDVSDFDPSDPDKSGREMLH